MTFDPIDPKIESNGPRIITNHPTKFHSIQEDVDLFHDLDLWPEWSQNAIRIKTFWLMRITPTHAHIQIHGDQNITFRIFNAKVMNMTECMNSW